MRIFALLAVGVLLTTGCSTTSPFAATAQSPVPIAAQIASNNGGVFGSSANSQSATQAFAPRQQFTQVGPNSYTQAPPNPGNPLLAGIRSTSASIGNALTFQPRVIPATGPTSPSSPAAIGADLHFQAAQVYETQQNIPEAISYYQKALAVSPQDPKILVGFGRLYDRQGDLQTAQRLYQQALQSDPNNCAALNASGICFAKQGNLVEALARLSRASQLQPNNIRYRNNMANVLADAGRTDEAFAQLVPVHGKAGAHYNLGYLLLQQGKRDAAQNQLALALQVNPRMEQARSLLHTIGPPQGAVSAPNAGLQQASGYPVSQSSGATAPTHQTPSHNIAGPQLPYSMSTATATVSHPFDPASLLVPQNLPQP